MNQYNNELQHHGVRGMKWGKRKARPISRSERKEIRSKIRQEKYEKTVKDNDKRVKMYGKNAVKIGGAIGIASTAYSMHLGNRFVKSIGKSSIKSIADNPNMGKAALHTASILTVAGMGAVTISSLKKMKTLRNDMRLADRYEERQYMYKHIKK